MTTKKQKRAAGFKKREAWLEERRLTGLKAQQGDQEHRKNKLRDSQREKHNKEHDWKVLDMKCILCQDRLEETHKEAERQQKLTEDENGKG